MLHASKVYNDHSHRNHRSPTEAKTYRVFTKASKHPTRTAINNSTEVKEARRRRDQPHLAEANGRPHAAPAVKSVNRRPEARPSDTAQTTMPCREPCRRVTRGVQPEGKNHLGFQPRPSSIRVPTGGQRQQIRRTKMQPCSITTRLLHHAAPTAAPPRATARPPDDRSQSLVHPHSVTVGPLVPLAPRQMLPTRPARRKTMQLHPTHLCLARGHRRSTALPGPLRASRTTVLRAL